MQRVIQIGKPSAQSVLDMLRQLAQREADEIKRLKQAVAERPQH